MSAQAVRLTSVDIDNALKNKHFEVIFQPIFRLSDGGVARVEAFVRWVHPGLGTLPPGAFISFFESQERMSELTQYVIETAIENYMQWRGKKGPGLSVNLAHSDLTESDFPAWLKKTIKRLDFPAELIMLECPTLPTSKAAQNAQKVIEDLKTTGVKLAIEVRGRANDSLREMSPFLFDEIKTGGSTILRFARTVRGGPGMNAISELLELAEQNEANITAVGVEDQASLQALAQLGFTCAQGNFLLSVGDILGFASSTINDVRKSLSLEPLSGEELTALFEEPSQLERNKSAKAQDHTLTLEAKDAVDLAADAPKTVKDQSQNVLTDPEDAKPVTKSPPKKERLSKQASKKLAVKRAQAKRREELAAKKAEENARKLQQRLSRAFTETKDRDSVTAGILMGGSLANTALNPKKETEALDASQEEAVPPSTQSDDSKKKAARKINHNNQPVGARFFKKDAQEDTSLEESNQDLSAGNVSSSVKDDSEIRIDHEDMPEESVLATQNAGTTDETNMAAEPSAPGDIHGDLPDEAQPEKDKASSQHSDVFSDVSISEKSTDETNRVSIETVEISEEIIEEITIDIVTNENQSVTASSIENGLEQPSSNASQSMDKNLPEEELFKTEDEVLDEVFHDSEPLDPTRPIGNPPAEQDNDGFVEILPEEQALASKLIRSPKKTRRKNFLQRKYDLRITHFWPRSWTRQRRLRARQRVYEMETEFE
ncbi:MAG: EAL domain-containing protein [bacterium]